MDINSEHIILYLQGELTREEQTLFEQKMDISPVFRKEVEDSCFIWKATSDLRMQRQVNVEKNWEKVSRQISRIRIRRQILSVARQIAAFLFLPLLLTTYFLATQKEAVKADMIEITSAYGLVSKVLLPDSSVVMLNSGSTLSYPSRFTGNTRRVSLTGEGYFTVQADKNHRFEVSLPGRVSVQAYGTEFNINAYDEQDEIEALLVTGRLQITQAGNKDVANLNPGYQATVNKNGNKPIRFSEANVYAQTAWKDGRIVFRRTRMDIVAKTLSRHFNVDIELQGKELSQYEYSATFVTESLQDILTLLSQSAPIQWHMIEPIKQQDNSYTRRKVIIGLRKTST